MTTPFRGVVNLDARDSVADVGRDGGSPVSADHLGEAPWAFTGTVHRVVVDVSGEPFVDIEREAVALFARE
jgi:arylsulfatase